MQNKQGTANNPIAIEEDEETTNEREVILEAARNKEILQQAQFTSQPLDLCFAVIKTNIQGDLSTKQRLLNKAIIKYFEKQIGINISCEHFLPRLEPDYSNPDTIPNPCELLLYGVDFLTTKLIKDRFTILQTNIRQIIWINDSTCKLIYNSAIQTQFFIKDQTKTVKMEQDSQTLPRGWFQINSYEIFSFERLLWARYATSAQKILEKSEKQSYEKFAIAKLQLGKYLLEKFNATSKYKIHVEELQRKRFLEKRRRRSPERGHSASRTRQKYRNNSPFQREFENDRRQPFHHRNRYNQNRFEMEEVHQVRYAHRPAKMNQSFAYDNSRNRGYNDRGRDHNTSFRYNRNNERQQYLDHKTNQNLNTSFNYNSNNNNPNKNQNLNLSFRQQQRGIRRCYDAAEIDSDYSFNQFGSIRRQNNERDDFHCDFNQEDKRSLLGGEVGASFMYDRQEQKDSDFNNSFHFDGRPSNQNAANLSFNFENAALINNNMNADQSFVINPNINDANKPRIDNEDFFERLNSNISSVREINQQDFNDNNSFEFDKNVDSKNKKSNNILSQSFYNQDSY